MSKSERAQPVPGLELRTLRTLRSLETPRPYFFFFFYGILLAVGKREMAHYRHQLVGYGVWLRMTTASVVVVVPLDQTHQNQTKPTK